MQERVELVLLPEQVAREQEFKPLIARQLRVSEKEIRDFRLQKRSIDARSRQVKIRLFFDVILHEGQLPTQESIREYGDVSNAEPVLIIGAGPAGLFAGLRLIEAGFKPIIVERGKDVRNRRRDLAAISREGTVNPDSNYCFGERNPRVQIT